MRLADITPAVIVEHRGLLLQTFGPATTNRYLSTLSHAFTIAMREWEWLDDTPFRRVSKQQEPRGRVRFLSDDERQRLLEACKASEHQYLYTVTVLALSTGARKMELLSLTWPVWSRSPSHLSFKPLQRIQKLFSLISVDALSIMQPEHE